MEERRRRRRRRDGVRDRVRDGGEEEEEEGWGEGWRYRVRDGGEGDLHQLFLRNTHTCKLAKTSGDSIDHYNNITFQRRCVRTHQNHLCDSPQCR